MFQSTTIKGSQELHQIMLDYLELLTLEQLEKLLKPVINFTMVKIVFGVKSLAFINNQI